MKCQRLDVLLEAVRLLRFESLDDARVQRSALVEPETGVGRLVGERMLRTLS